MTITNTNRDENLNHLEQLKKEGYTDLGWCHEIKEIRLRNRESLQPLRELDCSVQIGKKTNIVFIDDVCREILHVDMSN